MRIQIEVSGTPAPGGSKIPGMRKNGTMFVRPACERTSTWMSQVSFAAQQQYQGPLLTEDVTMTFIFRFPRPKRHYRTGKFSHVLRDDAPEMHITKPDLTKIIRSTEDALTGIVWKDDCQVSLRTSLKRYCLEGEQPGVTIHIH